MLEGVALSGARRRLVAPLALLGGAAAAVVMVAVVDPHQPGHYPTCPFLAMTGHYCPGCGSMRMVHDIATGDPVAGFHKNPLAFLLIPVIAYLWTRWVIASVRGEMIRSRLISKGAGWIFLVVTLVYWVVRNLPFGRSLAP